MELYYTNLILPKGLSTVENQKLSLINQVSMLKNDLIKKVVLKIIGKSFEDVHDELTKVPAIGSSYPQTFYYKFKQPKEVLLLRIESVEIDENNNHNISIKYFCPEYIECD